MEDLATLVLCEPLGSTFSAAVVSTVPRPVQSEPNTIVAAERALQAGDIAEARRLFASTASSSPCSEEPANFERIGTWPDAWLVAAIRCDPPDTKALDELANRYWKPLFGRCQMLVLNRDGACDLAQEAWCRVLKSRGSLKPEGNFPGYLNTIAMNIWRDRCRSERRAGAMAGHRILSLDTGVPGSDGETFSLGDAVPDLAALESEQQALLMMDIDDALERLAPLLRGVMVARFLMGETCAEIGRRHGRTEQTVSGWIRQGILEMKTCLLERGTSPQKTS